MGRRRLKQIKRLITVFGKERKNMEYNEANRIEVRYLRVLSNEQSKKIAKLEKKVEENEALQKQAEEKILKLAKEYPWYNPTVEKLLAWEDDGKPPKYSNY